MPGVQVVFYCEEDGTAPVLDWFAGLSDKAQAKCLARLERLRDVGYALRRPEADYLRDGIYELRVGLQGVNYRILYFFHGRTVAVLAHGLVKERRVPPQEIDRAVQRRQRFERAPSQHTYTEP